MNGSLIVTVLGVAILAAVAAPAAFALGSGWKWAELDRIARRRVLRVSGGVGVLFGTIAGVVAAILAAVSNTWWVSAIGSCAVTAGLVVWNLRTAAPVARVHRLAGQLDDPQTRESARRKVMQIVQAAPDDAVGTAIRLGAATVLSNARCFADARRLLEALPAEGLDAHDRELRALGLMECRLHSGELAGARAAMAEVPALEPDGIHAQTFANLQALILVHEGSADQALALINAPANDATMERGRRVVLAHAHAARGDLTSMHDCLAWLEQHHGRVGLARVSEPEGPASRFAREMLNRGASPYRTS